MNREQARNYLRSSGMSEEQIAGVESAFTCEDAISREYLVEHIKSCWTNGRPMYSPDLSELLSWIDDVPLVQPKPIECEDAISRQAAIDAIENTKSAKSEDGEIYVAKINAEMHIQQLPPVTVQKKPGRWITKIKSDLRGDMWPTNPKCSECGGEPYYSNTIYNYKFCPYCGARMGVEE